MYFPMRLCQFLTSVYFDKFLLNEFEVSIIQAMRYLISDGPFFFFFGYFQEYKRKLARVTQVRKELRVRLNNLPGGLYNSSK